MLKITVCDDNLDHLYFISELIESVLKKQSIPCQVIKFTDGEELLEFLYKKQGDIDISFIDIQLRDENGIQLAQAINNSFPQTRIIFITGHIFYAQDIFNAKPTYFLLKPVTENKMSEALAVAINETEAYNNASVTLNSKGHIYNLRLNYINYIMSDRRVVTIHEKDRIVELYAKLDDIQKELGEKFLRCHQSYIVNMDRIRSFDNLSILLYSGEVIPVSKNRYSEAKGTFLKYVGASL